MAEQKQAKEQNPNYKHIVRIANVDVQGEKQIRIALRKIKGIGVNFADFVCTAANVNNHIKAGNLSEEEVVRLNTAILNPAAHGVPSWAFNRKKDYESGEDMHLLTGTLNFAQDNDLKRLKKIKTLRGMRHIRGLPVRGQRTRSNFRRHKGKVVGVKKKAEPAKGGSAKTEKKK